MKTGELEKFDESQIKEVNDSVALAEDVVSEHYKMSAGQWLRKGYDVKTLADLDGNEIVFGPFAQIIRYAAKRKDAVLESSTYDFYKICLQDHSIISALAKNPLIDLFPFSLYIVAHELIHVVRFGTFMQSFTATETEKMAEESRVHELTYRILKPVKTEGLGQVFDYYAQWRSHKALP